MSILVWAAVGLAGIVAATHTPTPVGGNSGLPRTETVEQQGQTVMQQTTLPNGMNVIVLPDHRSPVVVHSVWFRAGSVDEQTGKTGIAHMLEHLMFKGTDKLPGKEREKIVSRNGAQENAFTSRDYTAYYQKVAVQNLPLMMELEADRMHRLKLDNDAFLPERKVVQEERRMRTDSQPAARFYEKLIAEHYAGHPYHHPVIGWGDDIAGYELEDALTWYRTHYAPNNATLILAGDITLEQAMPLVEKYYAPLKPAATPIRATKTLPNSSKAKVVEVVDAEVQAPLYSRFFRAPSAWVPSPNADVTDAAALEVLAEIFGGSETGRLYHALVKDKNMADGANADYDPVAATETSIDVYVRPKPKVTMQQVEKAVQEVIDTLVAKGVTEEELKRAKTNLRADVVYGQDDVFGQVYRLGTWLMAGGTMGATARTFQNWPAQQAAVTAADVQRVAKKYLTATNHTTGILVANTKQLGKK
ncbi:MAG: pitrilysin family protein [Alphaproteobacteria bacterium]